jgi:hypothetical protein
VGVARAFESGYVFRGEVSYIPDVIYNRASSSNGLERSATVRYLLGLDYLWRDWLLALQFNDRYIGRWRPDYFVPETQPLYTFSATGTGLSARLETRFAFSAIAHGDGLLTQVKQTYKPNDRWSVGWSLDLFNGGSDGFFGQFGDRDRLRLDVGYQF